MAKRPQAEARVKLLVCVIRREDEVLLGEVCNEMCVSLHFSSLAFGTVKSNYMSYLGLDEIEKRLFYALIPNYCEKQLLRAINKRLRLYLMGRGIAFTLPISGISHIISRAVLSTPMKEDGTISPRTSTTTEKERKKMHEMIVAVVNQKFTEDVVEAAREAGATGATILHTRSVSNAPAEQMIGTSFTTESDTVFLLTTNEFKMKIMESIRDAAGLKTDGGAVIFSLPIDSLVGIGRFDGNEQD